MNKKQKADRNNILMRMQEICSKTEKCSFDIRKKMNNSPLNEEDQDWVIEKLKEENFIDEERYATFFVKDKYKFNRWGKVKIRHVLKMKGIRGVVVEKALNKLDAADYREVLKETLKAKNKTVNARNIYDRKGRLFRFAFQKGYEPELIYQVMDEVLEEEV